MSKAKPGIPRAKYDQRDQQVQAEAVKKALDVGMRRTNNTLDSFITVRDLLKIRDGKLVINGVTITFSSGSE